MRRRVGAREARHALRAKRATGSVGASLKGGTYKPLSDRDIERVHHTALDVLEKVGMGNPLPILREHALAKGCRIDEHGRLCFPRTLVEDVITAMPKEFVVHAYGPDYDMENAAGRVHFGPGGDAVTTLDVNGRCYRPSTLVDVYDFARLIDRLEHVHDFSQVAVATDIPDLRAAKSPTAVSLPGARPSTPSKERVTKPSRRVGCARREEMGDASAVSSNPARQRED